jgi:iron-sulfur cluster assembly accessory protein
MATRQLVLDDAERSGKPLRVWLEGKGCDGFYYGVSFDQANGDDIVFISSGVQVVVDPQTIEYVDGSEIDWIDDERGRGFLVNNPNHKKFRGKFYKRQQWQERLRSNRDEARTSE